MADATKQVIRGITVGFKDSILGTFKVLKLDKEQDAKSQSESSSADKQPMTVLARRRAERVKPREHKVDKPPRIRERILLCCAWNGGVFWLSILVFYSILLPLLKVLTHFVFDTNEHTTVWTYISPVLSWTFGALWILPLFVLSKIVNSFWFQDIADSAYRKSRGKPQLFPSFGKIVADILFSLLLQSLFLIQGMLASLLPLPGIGYAVCLLHMCLLHSLYSFEYKWFNMGWEVQKRLAYIEVNWPYFTGFGLPLAILTSLPSSYIISGCVFSILFPLFIISANEAEPLVGIVDFPVRLFSPVVRISDLIFRQSVKRTGAPSSGKSTPTSSPKKKVRLQ